ncbi:MAG: hypothetical protein H6Q15_741 [Bacteroidetes bacterium]|nr:hypothetical protein [Bacteroidota bacterium]
MPLKKIADYLEKDFDFFQRNEVFLDFSLIKIYRNEAYFRGNKDFREITPYSKKIE